MKRHLSTVNIFHYLTPMFFLGIDIGTGSVKAVLINTNGEIIGTAHQHYPTNEPEPGYREQDANVVKNATFSVIKEIIGKCNQPQQIKSICFSAAMHSIMIVDAEGRPLTPLLLWSDTRSTEEADDIRYEKDASIIYRKCGTPVHPMLPLTKIKWLKRNAKEAFAAAYKFISIKEYICFHLLGRYIIDYSIASATGMFDIQELKWDITGLNNAGITYELLSEPVPTSAYTNKWREGIKAELNLPDDILFVAGSSDGCFANVGSHVIPNRDLAITIGTSAAVRITSPEPFFDPDESIFNYALANNLYISGGASNNGGNVVNWLKDFLKDNTLTEAKILERAFKIDAGSEGLVILPYLYGERAPVWDAKAKMVVYGMQAHHTPDHFCRAMIEGVVMNLYSIAEKLIKQQPGISRIIASGGFIQSPKWLQMVADVFNLPVHVSDNADASALGAAIWGGYSLGLMTEKNLTVHPAANIYQPEDWNHDFYMDNYAIFKELYSNNKY
ncbi:MAG: gluconate kinase [Sphingobacteriales bacterium]|nr:MAG: gluconate kinase [Sphingobacteriales bacterium]